MLGQRITVLGQRITVLGQRITVLGQCVTVLGQRITVLGAGVVMGKAISYLVRSKIQFIMIDLTRFAIQAKGPDGKWTRNTYIHIHVVHVTPFLVIFGSKIRSCEKSGPDVL